MNGALFISLLLKSIVLNSVWQSEINCMLGRKRAIGPNRIGTANDSFDWELFWQQNILLLTVKGVIVLEMGFCELFMFYGYVMY